MVCAGCLFISSCSKSPKEELLDKMESLPERYEDMMKTSIEKMKEGDMEAIAKWKEEGQEKEMEFRNEIQEILDKAKEKDGTDLMEDPDVKKKGEEIEKRIEEINKKYAKEVFGGLGDTVEDAVEGAAEEIEEALKGLDE